MSEHVVPFPQRWRRGLCKACRRIVLVENDTIHVCPHAGCGAVGRLVWKWVDLVVGFQTVRAIKEDEES